ncbi:MAG: dihydropteroate synthase [Gammaproteobacteria bacterium]|nr:dihydropteroate synthase [Gammaproteobacteria bacterium]
MRQLSCADKLLTFTHPLVMGVLNITPDSFSDGGLFYEGPHANQQAIVDAAGSMVEEGAAVLDVGGESTRPGASPVSVQEELDRVMPVICNIVSLGVVVSIDTRRAQVAQQAVAAGARMVNDVSAGADPQMLSLVASSGVAFVLMHMQGVPADMQDAPRYTSVVDNVRGYMCARMEACTQQGIGLNHLMLDPGFGFGKTMSHNLALLSELANLRIHNAPLLAGLSRKSMLGKISGRNVNHRQSISVAAALMAVERGADMVRVHDVAQTVDALKLHRALIEFER